jgi:hypothetical protein
MTTIAHAFLAFLAVPLATGHTEGLPAPALASVADPAARAALEEVQRGLQGLTGTVTRQARELEAQRAHSAALEARLGEAEDELRQHEEAAATQLRRAQEAPPQYHHQLLVAGANRVFIFERKKAALSINNRD